MHPIMSIKRGALPGAVAVALALGIAHAQISDSVRGPASEANHFIATPNGWDHPTTSWGDPDISATLNMMQAAGVPLERCATAIGGFGPPRPCSLEDKWVPEEQYDTQIEALENRVDQSRQALAEGNLGVSLQSGLMDPSRPQRQTNLIVDPPNGLLPALTSQAKARAFDMGSDWALPGEDINFQSQADFDSWDRCITRGMPSMMMPYRYNGGFKIHQSPGYVIFDIEMIHEARVIPIGDGNDLSPEIKQYLGHSKGHWEGNTLVIETTNYNGDPAANIPLINLAVVGSPPGNRFPISDRLKTTERVTRLNDEWWLYEITTEDPDVLTDSFTVRYPMHHDPEYWWPEYACHEDNTIVRNYTETNRYARANPTPEPPQEPASVGNQLAASLAGRWVGVPITRTIEYDIELEFTDNGDGTVNGRLIGTDLGAIDKPLRDFTITDRTMSFTFPNVDPWRFSGDISADGTEIVGVASSVQGSARLTFSPE
jgi:hypothetical protein